MQIAVVQSTITAVSREILTISHIHRFPGAQGSWSSSLTKPYLSHCCELTWNLLSKASVCTQTHLADRNMGQVLKQAGSAQVKWDYSQHARSLKFSCLVRKNPFTHVI